MFENLVAKRNLSIDRLATLCLIARSGSIGAAAGSNANRQSQFSRQIAELESFLGLDLLNRQSKPYRLNQQGEELSRICHNYLSALNDFVGACRDQPASLSIGAGESLIQWLLIPGVLPRLKEELQGVRVVFRNLRTRQIVDALENGEIDLGFVRQSALRSGMKTVGQFRFEYRLFVPRKFRAKLKNPVTWDQLSGLPMAVLQGGGSFRTGLEDLATGAGVRLSFETECSSSTQVALLVARKECAAILPAVAKSQFDPRSIESWRVEGLDTLCRTLVFAWNPKRASIRPVVEKAARICAG